MRGSTTTMSDALSAQASGDLIGRRCRLRSPGRDGRMTGGRTAWISRRMLRVAPRGPASDERRRRRLRSGGVDRSSGGGRASGVARSEVGHASTAQRGAASATRSGSGRSHQQHSWLPSPCLASPTFACGPRRWPPRRRRASPSGRRNARDRGAQPGRRPAPPGSPDIGPAPAAPVDDQPSFLVVLAGGHGSTLSPAAITSALRRKPVPTCASRAQARGQTGVRRSQYRHRS